VVVDFSFYRWVMEFLVRYLGLGDRVLRMEVLRYDEVLNRVKVLVRISDLGGNVVKYCVVRFDNALGKAEPKCVDNEDRAWKTYRETY
jgi:hypothetical protein